MMGMLITSHGDFCTGIIDSLKMISGSNEAIHSLKLDDKGIKDYSTRLHNKLNTLLKTYSSVIIFCDISGGTPYNECHRYILEKNVDIKLVSGMNLPMLIETSMALSHTPKLDSLVDIALEAGKSSIQKLIIEEIDNDLDI